MANRISTVLDLDGSSFGRSIKNIGTAVGEADGFMGKLKAGSKATFDGLKANAGAAALAAGASLVAFGIKAVGAFQEVAQEAKTLSTATGLAVDDASRWIAVADDYGVSSDQIAKAVGRVTKELDATKWAEFGIATRDASGAARDMNDIMLDSFDALARIENPTERAAAGTKLFGKAFADMSPMIGKSRDEYEKMLGSVEKGQVVTAKELEKSEKLRKAQDALGDALKEVTLAVGGLVAEIAPLIELTAGLVTGVTDAVDDIDNMNTSMTEGAAGSGVFKDALAALAEEEDRLSGKTAETDRENRRLTQGAAEATTAVDTEAQAMKDAEDATNNAKRALSNLSAEWDVLTGNLSEQSALLGLGDAFDDVKVKAVDAFTAVANGEADADAKVREHQQSIISLKEKVADYAREVGGISPEQTTDIFAAIDNGSISTAEQVLDQIARDRPVQYIPSVGRPVHYAVGTSSASPGLALVGERGPELMVMGGGEQVIPAGRTAGMLTAGGGGPLIENFHVHVMGSADQVTRDLAKFVRRNGPGPLRQLLGIN